MAVIPAHLPGTFCWSELATTDTADAKRFYGELFGWSAKDTPLGDGDVYSMMQVDGHDAAALFPQREEERAQNLPPRWRSYVAVSSADEATKRIEEAGGQVIAGPFDVFDAGRMTTAADPTGAVFAVWQSRAHIGAGWVADPGGVAWNELLTSDTASATQFYARAFGWAPEAQSGPTPYTVFKTGGRAVGGMTELSEQHGPRPPHWNVCFAVMDCDAAVELARTLGGRLIAPAADVPTVGRVATLADPQGATFSIVAVKSAASEPG